MNALARRLNPWMGRRVEICRAANERYFEALGVVGEPSPTRHLIDPVSRRIVRAGRPYRALRPIDPQETRLFRLLRAHGLIRKVSTTFYYQVTRKGVQVMTTALGPRELDLARLAA